MAELIISDENWQQHCDPGDGRCGTLARDFRKVPYGSIPGVPAGAEIPIIPMEEWPDRIADKERTKSTLKHLWAESPIGILNQGQVSYCHAFSAVGGAMLQRWQEGLPFKMLSASSVGGPVTGWRNAGAYIHDDLQQMIRGGIASTDFVPMLTTNRSDCKQGWEQDALRYKVTEWKDVPPRDFLIHGSLLLSNHPVIVGLNYWSHAVEDLVLRDLDQTKAATNWLRYGFEFANSWAATWGNAGFGIRTGNKALADAIYTIWQVTV